MQHIDIGWIEHIWAHIETAQGMVDDNIQYFPGGIIVIETDIDRKMAFAGHNIMLQTRIDLCNRHFYRSRQMILNREMKMRKPFDILNGFINGIIAFLARRVARASFGYTINYHRTFFGNGHVHTGWLANYGKRNGFKIV
ncbi:hypothetical protein D3C85_1504390 [compost metagenome]